MWWEWLFVLLGLMLVIPLVLAGIRRKRVQHRVHAVLRGDTAQRPVGPRRPFAD